MAGPRRFSIIAALALAACGEGGIQPPAADEATANRAAGPPAVGARSEIPARGGNGPFVGAVRMDDEFPLFVEYREVGGLAITGGDMIIGTHAQMQSQARQLAEAADLASLADDQRALAERVLADSPQSDRAAAAGRKSFAALARTLGWGTLGALWPVRVIPYRIDASIPEGVRRDNIASAVATWNAQAPIRLRPAAEMTPQERAQATTLVFTDHEDPDGDFACASWVGHQPTNDEQQLSLNPGCRPGNIMHEIGHAVGLRHEHQRTDRSTLIAVNANVPSDRVNYGTLRGRAASGHDLCSIMHYSPNTTRPAWFDLTEAGSRSFDTCSAALAEGCREVGQRCGLSAADRTSLAVLYPQRR